MGPEPFYTFEIVSVTGTVSSTSSPHRNLRVAGSTEFVKVIRRAFPRLPSGKGTAWREGQSDWWRMTLAGMSDADVAALSEFLHRLKSVLLLKNDLDECFALAWHSSAAGIDEVGQTLFRRTPMGDLVHASKPYDQGSHAGSKTKAIELASLLTEFVQAHPTYNRATAVVAVPPSNPNKPFDLPRLLAQHVARATGKADHSNALTKVRSTQPMKGLRGSVEKRQNIHGAFQADPAVVRDGRIILIDDLYGSGATISEAGRTLKGVGAALVLGLTATKNLGNR